MNDEEFDELLRDAAATYHTPPAAPREAMWDAIATARAAASVVPIASGRRAMPWLLGSAAAAAALLMIGVAIGRQSRTTDSSVKQVASMETAAPTSARLMAAPDTSARTEPSSLVNEATSVASPHGRKLAGPRAPRAAATQLEARGARPGAQNGSSLESFNDANAYRLAVIEHLTRTEVLLTDFRAEARSGAPARLDAQLASLSRELLGTTRLLLATRRGEDPVMTRLLQDLEFVLMQLSQYANDGRRVDLDAINQSIDRRNVLPKLRYSIPSGVSASAGT